MDGLDWSEYRRVRKNYISQIRYYENKYNVEFEESRPLSVSVLQFWNEDITQADIERMTQEIREKAKNVKESPARPVGNKADSSEAANDLYNDYAPLQEFTHSRHDYFMAYQNLYSKLGLPVPEKAYRSNGKYYDKPPEVQAAAIDAINDIIFRVDQMVNSLGIVTVGKIIFENSQEINSWVDLIRETYRIEDVESGHQEVCFIFNQGMASEEDLMELSEHSYEYWDDDFY